MNGRGRRLYDEPEYRRRVAELRRVGDVLCWLCGQPGADTLDHVVPIAHGGDNAVDNLRPAHLACNASRGARPPRPRPRRRSRLW